MSLLKQLENNKGTVSSALSKSLAKKVLDGEPAILEEAVDLLDHSHKNVRAGAAKIIEQVSTKKPEMVVTFLPKLIPALNVTEPQTRWMIINTIGMCASLDSKTAIKVLGKAEEYIKKNSGTCLWSATISYLGNIGSTSKANAKKVFPLLEFALNHYPNLTKKVLESLILLLDNADKTMKSRIEEYCTSFSDSKKPSIKKVANKLIRRLNQ